MPTREEGGAVSQALSIGLRQKCHLKYVHMRYLFAFYLCAVI